MRLQPPSGPPHLQIAVRSHWRPRYRWIRHFLRFERWVRPSHARSCGDLNGTTPEGGRLLPPSHKSPERVTTAQWPMRSCDNRFLTSKTPQDTLDAGNENMTQVALFTVSSISPQTHRSQFTDRSCLCLGLDVKSRRHHCRLKKSE